jgi:histidinol-phosphate aminotransferase
MYIQSYCKNSNYLISKRNYNDDYSNIESLKIDMTMSGKYLSDYPKFDFDTKKFCEYPMHKEIRSLELNLKKIFKIKKRVIIGSGSNGILQNLVKIFFKNGGNLVTPYLTFNQVEYAVSSMNCYTRRVYMKDYKINFSRLYKSIDENTKMVYICNPNNPTGLICSNNDILDLASKIKCMLVVDESAIEFSNIRSLVEFNFPSNILIVRTFSKAYGLANLRVGYLICDSKVEKLYKENITVNEVSGISCILAKKVLDSSNYQENVFLINKEKEYLINEFKRLGIECYNSQSNTLLTKNSFDCNLLKKLCENEISILPVHSQNGKIEIRIAVQDHKTNKEFIERFTKCLM